jgi:hypothetical protein
MITLMVTPDTFIMTIPRSLFREARCDRIVLGALVQALSTEGLREAAGYLLEAAEDRTGPSAVDRVIGERSNGPSMIQEREGKVIAFDERRKSKPKGE